MAKFFCKHSNYLLIKIINASSHVQVYQVTHNGAAGQSVSRTAHCSTSTSSDKSLFKFLPAASTLVHLIANSFWDDS